MSEFPKVFAYNGDFSCDGLPAKERADWLTKNQGMNLEQAQAKVMSEFPQVVS